MGQSYTVGGDTLQDIGHQYYAAQTFTPQVTHTLNCIDINLRTVDETRAPTLWVYLADAEHKPTGDPLSEDIRSSADNWNLYNVFRMRAIMKPTLLTQDTEYVIVVHAFALAQAYHMQWQYDNNDATYTRGIRLISNDGGETWDAHPGDDHIFTEFGTAPIPEPPPDPPTTKWFIVSIEQILTATGYKIVVTTNVPCHLWMRWTTVEPREHLIQRTKRGLPLMLEKYFCFDVYEDNEQEEAGDTLIHTFIKEPWPVCETRYFYFQGEIAGVASKSTSTIFSKHRTEPPGPPPPESPIILRPNAPGDETNLDQFPAAGQNWDKVCEVVPDEEATVVRNWRAFMLRDLYNLPTPEHWGTIDKIIVKSRCRRIATASGSYKELWIKSGGAFGQGDLRVITVGWEDRQYSWPIRPYDGQPWEWSDIDALQIGISIQNGGIQWAMCTQLFVEIHFTV